jgi:hypothetical protein
VVLGRLGNAAHPSGESGQGGHHRKMSSMVMCGRPEGNGGGGRHPDVVVGSLRCGEVILNGAVLEVWSNRSKRG